MLSISKIEPEEILLIVLTHGDFDHDSHTPQRFDIKAGKLTIKLISESDKAIVAQIMITDKPSWDPVKGMSLLGKIPPVSK